MFQWYSGKRVWAIMAFLFKKGTNELISVIWHSITAFDSVNHNITIIYKSLPSTSESNVSLTTGRRETTVSTSELQSHTSNRLRHD